MLIGFYSVFLPTDINSNRLLHKPTSQEFKSASSTYFLEIHCITTNLNCKVIAIKQTLQLLNSLHENTTDSVVLVTTFKLKRTT